MIDSRTISRGLVLGFCAIYLIGCSSSSTRKAAPSNSADGPSISLLEGRDWRIVRLEEDHIPNWPHRGLVRRDKPYIALHDGTINGSPGCGTIAGTYSGSGNQISIVVQAINDSRLNCDGEDRNDASQIVAGLNRVQNIRAKPAYWQDDAFLLADMKNHTRIILSPMKTGADLSDLRDTFWSLSKLEGAGPRLSDAVIWIQEGEITFSSRSCFFSYPFNYELTGLKFYPAWTRQWDSKNALLAGDKRVAGAFEQALHRIASYQIKQNSLFFSAKERPSFLILGRIHPKSVEAHRWRIVEYRGRPSGETDGLTTAKEFADVTFLHGRVIGSPGCGGWAGSYRLSHDTLSAKNNFVLAAGACSSEGSAEAEAVVKALNGDLHVEQEENRVLLRGSDGRVNLELAPF